MNPISRSSKILLFTFTVSLAALIVVVRVLFFTPSEKFTFPVYFITSSGNNLEIVNDGDSYSCLSTITKDENFKVLKEDSVLIINGIPELLTHLNETIKDSTRSSYLFKIERPTDVNKKILRQEIEEYFSGEERALVQQNMIAMIDLKNYESNDPNSPDYRQFKDDLIYFEWNFGGVGLLVKNIEKNDLEKYCDIILKTLIDPENYSK